ncbi:MAG: hypothetical protein JO061_24280 [Acidobacteriaceae bacterium]|nr:hypothetical protein [Acidobacteriaceae bacterium]
MDALDSVLESLKREFEASRADAVRLVRSQATAELNQIARRLRQYGSEEEWVQAVLDGASLYARQAALFSVNGEKLQLRGTQGLEIMPATNFTIASAQAFLSVIASRDPIVTLRTSSEVGEALQSGDRSSRAHLFPVVNGDRVVAVLFATAEGELTVDGLEAVTSIASMALERGSNATKAVQISPLNPTHESAKLPPWSGLNEEDRNLHLRAQRFARVRVAEMQLTRPEACRAGLEQNNVYLFLQKEIDAAREAYRSQFMKVPSMVDYLHVELVRNAAENDEARLGGDYPGQLG